MQFEALVNAYSADLYRYAIWLCKDSARAEDLVQETFMRAWKSLGKLRDDKSSKPWLITILRREFLRSLEKNRNEVTVETDLAEVIEGDSGYDTRTEAFVLRRALADLPDEYREPLVLQVLGGYSSEEIADMLEISKANVLTRLFRARKKMRDILEHDGESALRGDVR